MADEQGDVQGQGRSDPTCPWCDYTDAVLKKVLHHMESGHPGKARHNRLCWVSGGDQSSTP
jgi:hypothetical protein